MKCYIKDYPRPQFMRTDWENLNGTWDFGLMMKMPGKKRNGIRNSKVIKRSMFRSHMRQS